MIVKEYHPFSIVEDPEFINFISMLCPGYKLPSRKTVSQILLSQTYNSCIEVVKKNLENATAICITTDGWTSLINESFVAITAHWISETELKSNLLECVPFYEQHTAENLSKLLKEKFEEWDISNKIACVVSDNAANIVAAIRNGNWRHLGCFAHTLNLIVQKGLKEIEQILNKVRRIVEYFKRSSHALSKLNQLQEQMKLPILKLKMDVCTRWNSTWDMIRRVTDLQEPVISALALLRNNLFLSEDEWETLKHAADVLKIFDDATKEISGEKSITISKILFLIKAIERHCLQLQKKDLSGDLQRMITVFLAQIEDRFKNIEKNELLCQATLLDPRFKKFGFSDAGKANLSIETLKKKISTLQIDIQVEEPDPTKVKIPEENSSSSLLWKDFDDMVGKSKATGNPMAASIIEFDKYISEPVIPRSENPLVWWSQRKAIYPRLYNLALKRLCITATSVPCERIFSKAGQIVTEKRSRLKSSKIKQIVFLNSNL